jgi:hypothetical protein
MVKSILIHTKRNQKKTAATQNTTHTQVKTLPIN